MTTKFLHIAAVFLTAASCTVAHAAPAPPRPASPPAAPTATADKSAEQVLERRGLKRVGSYFLVEQDAGLAASVKQIARTQALLKQYRDNRRRLELEIEVSRGLAERTKRDVAATEAEMAKARGDSRRYNALAREYKSRLKRSTAEAEHVRDREEALKKLTPPMDEVTATGKLIADLNAALDQYDRLASDAEVTAALKKLNDSSKVVHKLGPSAGLKAELPRLLKQKQALSDEAIPFTMSQGVPEVTVMLNGFNNVPMILDSGAGLVTLTADVVAKSALKIPADAPEATLVTADGTEVKAKLILLPSIKLGRFTVRNVVCAVMPASVKGDACLLGGTFLKHFIYRMDLSAKQIHLIPLDEDKVSVEKPQ